MKKGRTFLSHLFHHSFRKVSLPRFCLLAVLVAALSLPSAGAAGSAVNGRIAWMSSQDMANWDIWSMDLDGTGAANLSLTGDPTNLYTDRDPHFRPDGAKIVFTSQRSGDSATRLYTMDADGANVTALTPVAAYAAGTARYSWDGKRVVFRKSGGENCLAYFKADSPAETMTNIPGTGGTDLWPSFSPDGQWITFQRAYGSFYKICRVRLDGSGLVELTPGNHLDEMPGYSPDGTHIIFKRGGTVAENADIYRMSAADGSGLTNLTNTASAPPACSSEDAPAYSYEGDLIAYQCGSSGPASTEIYVVAGGARRQLTSNTSVDFNPTFSVNAAPALTLRLTKSAYTAGETVTISEFRLRNFRASAKAGELKVWLGILGASQLSISNIGSDGSFVVPVGYNQNFAPLTLFTVPADWPKGSYEVSSRVVDPVTGKTIHESLNPFVIQ